MELDHFFILCEAGAPEADALMHLGLREGDANTHPGQGTACRRFFFGNTYLELLWVASEQEARQEATARTQLWERWSARQAGACPFGILLRPSPDDPADAHPPFPTWPYPPAYLPPGLAIDIASDTPTDQPFVGFLAFQRERARRTQPIGHGMAIGHLTGARVDGPLDGRSPAIEALCNEQLIAIAPAAAWHLTLTFDRGESGREADCRPTLPLTLCW